jgi:RES domain-containing protein
VINGAIRARAEAELLASPRAAIRWTPAVRIVPRFPPIDVLEQLDGGLQAAALAELVATVPHLIGRTSLLPAGPLPTGPGASRLITGFTFSRPGRFNDDTFAAFYGADSLPTAIEETVYHMEAALNAVAAPAQTMERIALHVDVEAADAVDIRASSYAALYDPSDYTESQVFGAVARERAAPGILFRSVRRPGGECAAIYDMPALSNCRDGRAFEYRYDGANVAVFEIHYP